MVIIIIIILLWSKARSQIAKQKNKIFDVDSFTFPHEILYDVS